MMTAGVAVKSLKMNFPFRISVTLLETQEAYLKILTVLLFDENALTGRERPESQKGPSTPLSQSSHVV